MTARPPPKPFIVCVDRFDAPDGKVWAVRQGGRWFTTRTVIIDTAIRSVFLGPTARQPKAYFAGVGRLHYSPTAIRITAT